MTKSERACSRCGAALPAAALEGLCPKCVVRLSVTPYLAAGVAAPTEDSAAGAGHEPQIAPEFGNALHRFGDYELLEEIARGGMGAVYRARQVSLDRVVALKMVLSGQFASEGEVKRFRAEAGAAAHLDHPHIVPIYEVGEHEGRCFFTMKLIEGPSLAERMQEDSGRRLEVGGRKSEVRPLTPDISLLAKVARAVHHAHQRGVLHRDLKPANILLDAQGEPYITDFGLARRLESETLLTQTGATLGTPAYMAPEQAAGEHGITIAADVWSLGAMLFHLLAGRPPFTGASASDVLLKVRTQEAPFPRSLNPAVPADLETICLKCLEKDPQRRYNSAAGLADDLERFLCGEPIHARPSTPVERVLKWIKRHPARAGVTAAFLLVLIAGVAGITSQWNRAEKALTVSQESLWQANFDRAHALRTSRQMGQRVEALKAIRAAAAIRPTPELREEAIAAMALTDLEDIGDWHVLPPGVPLTVDSQFKLLALSRQDGVIEIRDFKTGRLRATLTNGPPAAAIAFTDSADLLQANNVARCRIWDWQTTNLIKDLSTATFRSLSGDGRWLLSADSTSSVAWTEFRAGGELGRLDGIKSTNAGFLFSPGKELLSLASGHDHEVWRLEDQKRLGKLTLADSTIGTLWHPSEPILAIGCEDHNVYVWDVLADRLQKLVGHRREGVMPYWHPGGNLLASTSWDEVLRLWNPYAGVQLLETTFGRPRNFSADGQWLTVNNARGIGRLKVHIPEECRLFHLPMGWHQSFGVTFSPDDRFVAGSAEDGLWIWEVASGRRVAHESLDRATSVQFTGPRTFVTTGPRGILLWTNAHPADGWMLQHQLFAPSSDKPARGGSLNPSRTQLVVHKGSTGQVYDFPSGYLRFTLSGQRLFGGAVFSSDGQWLASGYFDNSGQRRSEFCIWSVDGGQPVRKIPMGNCSPVFSSDGRWLLVAEEKKYFQFAINGHPTNWTVARQYSREVSTLASGPAAFSGDGKLLALQADARVFRLLEASTGRELARLTPLPQSNGTGYCNFSPNGRWFAAVSDIGLHVWDLQLIRQRLREMNLDWVGPPELKGVTNSE